MSFARNLPDMILANRVSRTVGEGAGLDVRGNTSPNPAPTKVRLEVPRCCLIGMVGGRNARGRETGSSSPDRWSSSSEPAPRRSTSPNAER